MNQKHLVLPPWPDLETRATDHARRRRASAIQADRQDRLKSPNANPLRQDILGAIGELLLARFLGLADAVTYANHVDNGTDLVKDGIRYGVKTTRRVLRGNGPMLIIPSHQVESALQHPDMRLVLICRTPSEEWCIAGWAFIGDMQRERMHMCCGKGDCPKGRVHTFASDVDCANPSDWCAPASWLRQVSTLTT